MSFIFLIIWSWPDFSSPWKSPDCFYILYTAKFHDIVLSYIVLNFQHHLQFRETSSPSVLRKKKLYYFFDNRCPRFSFSGVPTRRMCTSRINSLLPYLLSYYYWYVWFKKKTWFFNSCTIIYKSSFLFSDSSFYKTSSSLPTMWYLLTLKL